APGGVSISDPADRFERAAVAAADRITARADFRPGPSGDASWALSEPQVAAGRTPPADRPGIAVQRSCTAGDITQQETLDAFMTLHVMNAAWQRIQSAWHQIQSLHRWLQGEESEEEGGEMEWSIQRAAIVAGAFNHLAAKPAAG